MDQPVTGGRPAPTLLSETVVSFAQAARTLPPFRGDRPVNPSTLWRWGTDGVRLPDGTRLRLEIVRIGGRFVTSAEAVGRFSAAQTAAFQAARGDQSSAPAPVGKPPRLPPASIAAAAQLEAIGA